MRVYRLCRAEYSATVLSGAGGLVAAGRWHAHGRRIVYTASSEALAVLELRVHLGRFLPKVAHRMHAIDVPEDAIATPASPDLPVDWNAVPYHLASQAVGDAWLAATTSLALRMPSIHVRTEFTVLVNPEHPRAIDARVVDTWSVEFDPRLFARSTSGA
jgi:RES domain-containing protein